MLRVRLWDEREGKEDTGKQSRSPHQELLGIQTIRLSLLRTGTGVGVGVSGGGSLWGPDNSGISLIFFGDRVLLCPLGWPRSQRPPCLCHQSAEIESACQHAQPGARLFRELTG